MDAHMLLRTRYAALRQRQVQDRPWVVEMRLRSRDS